MGTTRRTLVRGAAWTVPVVAVAAQAPAFAASPCDPQTYKIDWGTSAYSPPTSSAPNAGTATANPSGQGSNMSVTFTSTFQGTATTYSGNLTVLSTLNIGGLGATERGLAVRSGSTGGLNNTQTLTVLFPRAVQNLSFTVVDIDRAANFWDRVSFNPTPTNPTNGRAATVGGIGAYNTTETSRDAGAYRYTGTNVEGLDDTDPGGNATVTFAGPLTSLQLLYWNAGTPGPQGILLSDFTFSARGC